MAPAKPECGWKQGEPGGRNTEQHTGRQAVPISPWGACHSLISHDLASEPPVKASLGLAGSLRSQRSALTGTRLRRGRALT